VELRVEIVSADAVRDLIGRAILADEMAADGATSSPASNFPGRLGSIVLRRHQILAVSRLNAALDEFGGALLADEVGMGKTFVALAVAARFHRPIVVAPAVLRDMWTQQARAAGIEIPILSFESLSRGRNVAGHFDLIVIDEAHHLRNPVTRRYRELSRIALRSQVLMLSATPVHNKRSDLVALLAIFMGSRAESLSPAEISRCVVRRSVESAGLVESIPRTSDLVWKELLDDTNVPAALLSLPPPLPVRDGGVGGVLVARLLIRQWCSSDAALEAALRRRIARSIALISALESGHYPSAEELSAWTVADDSVQLAFPSMVATPQSDSRDLLGTIEEHQKALRELLRSLDPRHPRDKSRAEFLREIRRTHPGIPVVAFSQYAETVNALFRELRSDSGIAVLTAKGARVAGGALSRSEAIRRFAPRASGVAPPRYVERVDLLLATDLLSEGVNLQDAGVVVHLDLPWTAARLEQRMGRVARMGSLRHRVYAYGIRPPAAAEVLIRLEATIAAKMVEAEMSRAPTAVDEHIRSVARSWSAPGVVPPGERLSFTSEIIYVAEIESRRSGFIAICSQGSRLSLFASDGRRVTSDPSELLDVLLHAAGRDMIPQVQMIDGVIDMLNRHLRSGHIVALADSRSASVARTRRAALRRVSAIVEKARPHARSQMLELATTARKSILGRLGVAAELELMRQAKTDLGDEDWLRAVGDSAGAVIPAARESGDERIGAVLLFGQSQASEP